MTSLNKFPAIMDHARVDLSANVSGQFSPEDWERILAQAYEKLQANMSSGLPERQAWEQVMLDFYRNRYWDFLPNYRRSKDPKRKSSGFGLRVILMTVISMTVTKMGLAWTGQRYTSSDDPRDAYIFFALLFLVIANAVFFLWRARNYRDVRDEQVVEEPPREAKRL